MVSTLQESARITADVETLQPAGRPLDFQQTIPRSLVHRAAVSEVFVTDLKVLGDDVFEVAAQWPRRHAFFGPTTPDTHDPMLFAETCRQAGLLIAHRAFGIPLGYGFLSDHKTYSVDSGGLGTVDRPVDVVLQVKAHDVLCRGPRVAGMRLDFECFRDGRHVGSTSERWRCVSPAVYRRVRGDRFAATPFQTTVRATVAPDTVGRADAGDVLVADTDEAGTWSLQFDPDHAVLFDHTVDHVPGMVLVEAARQVALLTVDDPWALPLHGDFEFVTYVEFDQECVLHAVEEDPAVEGTRSVRVTFRQNGVDVAFAVLGMRAS